MLERRGISADHRHRAYVQRCWQREADRALSMALPDEAFAVWLGGTICHDIVWRSCYIVQR